MTQFDDVYEQVATPAQNELYAETVIYFSASGERRSGKARVSEGSSTADVETGIDASDELLVIAQRRASSENPDALVIGNPQIGDAVRREADQDQTKRYSFTGEKMHVTADSWQLRFVRKVPYLTGQIQRR